MYHYVLKKTENSSLIKFLKNYNFLAFFWSSSDSFLKKKIDFLYILQGINFYQIGHGNSFLISSFENVYFLAF